MLHRVVGRHKNGVVSACFEKVVHCGTFLAALGVLKHEIIIAQIGVFLDIVGYRLPVEHINVRLIHFVGT